MNSEVKEILQRIFYQEALFCMPEGPEFMLCGFRGAVGERETCSISAGHPWPVRLCELFLLVK